MNRSETVMKKFSLPKSLRLKKNKSINSVFNYGRNFSCPPLRIFYYFNNNSTFYLPKTAFTVPKKNFKRAVDRNLLKRKMREAYRLNKEIILNEDIKLPAGLEIIFLYSSMEINTFETIQSSLINLLNKVVASVTNHIEPAL